MIKKFKPWVYSIFCLIYTLPSMISAACTTSSGTDGIQTYVFGCVPKDNALKGYVGQLFVWVASVIGGLGVLGLIYAGFLYITSAGNPDQLKTAKDVITTSIASILIVIFSWALFSLIFKTMPS